MTAKRSQSNVPDEGWCFIFSISFSFLLTNNSDPMTTVTIVVTTVNVVIARATVIHATCTSADFGHNVDKATLLSLSKIVPRKSKRTEPIITYVNVLLLSKVQYMYLYIYQ